VRAIGLPDPSRRRNLCWSNATAITSAVREGDAPFTLNEASDSERQLIFQRCCNRTRPFDLRLAIGTRTSTSADAGIRHCNVAADVRLDFDRGRRRTLPTSAQGQLAWIVRKVSEVDITESDRRLGAWRGGSAGMAGIERIDGRLDASRTCDDQASAAIPINMPSDAYGMQVQMNCT
jgi:hypothetical protein